jgi:hypothetical protein
MSINYKIAPVGDLVLGGGGSSLVVLGSDLSLSGVLPSQVQGVLGVVPGTDVQAQSAALDDIDALGAATGADQFIYSTGAGTFAYGDITTAGRNLIDDTDVSAQQTTLSLVPGTNVQAQSAVLDDIDAIGAATGGDQFIYSTAAGTFAYGDITTAGRNLIDDTDVSAQQTTLSLVPGTDVQAYSALLADIAGLTPSDGDIIQYNGANFVGVQLDAVNNDNVVYSTQTADGVATDLSLTAHSASTTDMVDAFITAVSDTTDTNFMVWRAKFAVHTTSGGTTTIAGTQNITLEHDSNTNGWTVNGFNIAANTLRINITGAADVNWKVSVVRYSTAHANA